MASVGQHKRERLKAALIASKGNASEARRRIMKELESDDLLFREIAAPFMHGLVSHAIDTYAKAVGLPTSMSPRQPEKAEEPAPTQQLDPEILDQVIGQMGRNAGPTPTASDKPVEHNPQKQANTMRALADLYKKRRVEDY
ncbi:MAG: hypothetical protein CBB62_08910 [Micavibrio sp. TMED2]|nr:hypothetical protein [Alphaproteobacteria bacterium]OUT42384.1 MAG: hypothetical protein CBB62_08910 [Micavibrio sp. TMED2]|tara:strand:+ start:19524 stop:19946 length:423 start_codon:yes stop_codon:yes gene_type:complete